MVAPLLQIHSSLALEQNGEPVTGLPSELVVHAGEVKVDKLANGVTIPVCGAVVGAVVTLGLTVIDSWR